MLKKLIYNSFKLEGSMYPLCPLQVHLVFVYLLLKFRR